MQRMRASFVYETKLFLEGKGSESDQHFATAAAMYSEMGMTYWFERVQRDMQEAP
jgi:hypothetical protein